MAPPGPQQFVSKTSDAIRRRLSSVSGTAKPNITAFSSLQVRLFLSISRQSTKVFVAYVGWHFGLPPPQQRVL